ncbi:MAG TPA: hypothetical protein VF175_11730 [Lacipirellula sp.]
MWRSLGRVCALGAAWVLSAGPALALPMSAVTIDFETEDDFVTPLVHGQSVYSTARPDRPSGPAVAYSQDDVLEFGNLFNISSTVIGGGAGHLGPAIFNSNLGPAQTQDDDLLVDLGNMLLLHRTEGPNHSFNGANGLVFNNPNDEADPEDRGSIVFDFLVPLVRPTSVDLADIDDNVEIVVVLTDNLGRTRTYLVPEKWTTDINLNPASMGYRTLDLQTLLAQAADPLAGGLPAVAVQEVGYNGNHVVQMEFQFVGSSPSGAIDNLVFEMIPEPAAGTLAMTALGCVLARRRQWQKA